MSDSLPDPLPRKGETLGVSAYRMIMMGMMAIALLAAKGTYDKLDKTVETLASVNQSIVALNGRLDAQADRLAEQDRRIGRLETPYFSTPTHKTSP